MRRWILCCAWLVVAWLPALASAGELAVGAQDSYALTPAFSYFEDKDAALSFDEVLQPAIQSQFRRLPKAAGANFGLTNSAIWLRITLNAQTGIPRDWLLELAYPPLDRLDMWSPDAAFGYERQVAGDLLPFGERVVAHRNHVLPVRLVPGASTTLYLRLVSEGTVSAPIRLWQPAALWKHDQAAYAALSLYFGLLIGLFLYNLLLFVSVRDTAYLVYVAFVAGMAVAQAALTGMGYQFLWPQLTWWNSVSPPAGMCIAAVFGLLFARSFLSSAARMPAVDRLLQVLVAGWLVSLAAALVLPYIWSTWMVTVLAVITVAALVATGALSVQRRYPGARYFLTAWALLLAGVLTLFLHNIGLLPSNALTSNALLIGSALEMVLLSFALADRINVARRFKEQAQVRIAAEHAMVEALEESQARLKTVLEEREIILESSIVGIAFLTPAGRLKWANKAMMDIFGATGREGVTSMEPFYLSREEYLRVGGDVAACVARGEVYETELQVRQYDGTLIWISLSGKAVSRSDLGQGTVWVIFNISQRKRLEEQLQATMSEREAILNNALVGIVLSVRRRHEWINDKFAQMMGYPREELIGRSSSHLHPTEAAWQEFGALARASLIATGSCTHELQLKRRNGELFWVEMGGSCIRPNDPDSGVIWTLLDITQRKKSEQEIREALEQQKALNELRTRFVAMTSHEFRTPLAAILSAEELLRHYGDRLPREERIEILDGIAAGVQRMSRMMDRVLLLGRADAQMLEFAPQPMDLPSLCRQLVDEARAQQQGGARDVVLQCAADVGHGLYDEKLLRHIFGNLLSNAIKYSPGGGTVHFNISRVDGETVLEVRDQGIGIPADEVAHLFESFHRASNVGQIPGTGLGLAIVKNAVEVHGGRITVESVLGRGTVFTVRLPA
jgi:PAS domain S-box-containing protein